MPYVKCISIRSTVYKSLKYILNPDKTENLLYASSMNCMTSAKDAYLEMKSVFESYSTEKYDAPLPLEGKGSVKALHYIQSFDPKDNVSPELAHRIAKAFARKTFGDDVQVVIATHTDREHVHSHLIINTYTLTGRKLNDNQQTLKQVREYSDRVCMAFGIQPIQPKEGKEKGVCYHEWEQQKNGTSWKEKLRCEIDSLIGSVKNLDELLYELELKGYEVKKGKYISLKAPGQGRFIRTKTLGEEYTTDSLVSRILWYDVGYHTALTDETSPLRECYQVVIGQVMQLVVQNKKVQRRRDRTAPYSPQNDLDVYRLSAQLTIINRDHIRSIGELEEKIDTLKASHEQTRQELNELTVQHDTLSSLIKQAETYFELSAKPKLSKLEQVQLTVSKQSVTTHCITTVSDLARLKETLSATDKKLTALKENFKHCQQLYYVYSDIAKTYHEISQGDYISRLVDEARKQRDKEYERKESAR
ncbi:relaxase/mobilization nuclease domain-containing protein [Ruminococcus sp. XPD3002]|uniref:relaxase/mobilization nuclease domain-containing protein n=1 Tax=Ruminococcus sp. XPD3002 TaxID=1452269 RepID=UPI0009192F83|nr:Relaxase/Mobilisation nuclease domain-containing protein [Ruminococcus flavefaciens]